MISHEKKEKNFVIFEVSSNKKCLSLTNQNTELGVSIPGHMRLTRQQVELKMFFSQARSASGFFLFF